MLVNGINDNFLFFMLVITVVICMVFILIILHVVHYNIKGRYMVFKDIFTGRRIIYSKPGVFFTRPWIIRNTMKTDMRGCHCHMGESSFSAAPVCLDMVIYAKGELDGVKGKIFTCVEMEIHIKNKELFFGHTSEKDPFVEIYKLTMDAAKIFMESHTTIFTRDEFINFIETRVQKETDGVNVALKPDNIDFIPNQIQIV